MKKVILSLFLTLFVSIAVASEGGKSYPSSDNPITTELQKKVDINVTCEQLKKEGASAELLAQRGCCSWHDGVCGCSYGRVKCCDGTLSPSCKC